MGGIALVYGTPARGGERPYSRYPAEARARYEQGLALQKQGQPRDALHAFDAAVQLGMQDYPRLYLARAAAAAAVRDHFQAVAAYTKLIDEFGVARSCRR
jgi:hypothetical protein